MPISTHKLLALLGIAIAANLDNLGVGAAYGGAKRRIPAWANGMIAALAIVLTYGAIASGKILQMLLPVWIANDIGAFLILLIGIWIYWEPEIQQRRLIHYYRTKHRESLLIEKMATASSGVASESSVTSFPSSLPYPKRRTVDIKETIVLGISLALNAMVTGFGAGLSGYNMVVTAIAVGIFSYLAINLGQHIAGSYLSRWFGKMAPRFSGILLITISLYEFLS